MVFLESSTLGVWPLILGASTVLLVTIVAFKTLRQYARLRHIKGPPGVGFSKLWMIRHVSGGTMHKDLGEVNERYGMDLLREICYPVLIGS